MICSFCHHHIHSNRFGFVVCPHCGHVTHRSSHHSTHHKTSHKPFERHFKKLRHLLKHHRIVAVGFGLFVLTCFVAVAVQKNIQASTQIDNALILDKSGNYLQAADLLQKLQSPLLITPTKHSVTLEIKNNQTWVKYYGYQIKATRLVKDQKYTDALALLRKITADYPTYKAVNSDIAAANRLLTAANQKTLGVAKQKVPAKTIPVAAETIKIQPPVATESSPPAVGCFPPSAISGKRYVTTAAFKSVLNATSVDQVQQILQGFFSQYDLGVEITNVAPSAYVTTYDTYSLITDSELCQLKAYGAIMVDEWSKYPIDWVVNSNVKNIVLIKDLAVQGQRRAATPDVGGFDMYYNATYSGDYAREVIHHEYDHLVMFNYYGTFYPDDPTWDSYNPQGFSYGNGGAACSNPGNTCLTGEHPVAGFVTGYATSGMEEDKAELFAYLMTGTYYHHLQSWLDGDPNLASKVNNYEQFIASHSSEMSGDYFDQINP